MVGLPNRAARCTICQRHKIKCDASRPTCSRCKRLHLSCVYVNLKPGQVFVNRNLTHPLVKASDILSITEKGKPGAQEKASRKYGRSPREPERHGHLRNNPITKSPTSDAVHQVQLLSTFIGLYLPRITQGTPVHGQSPATWVHQLPDLATTNNAYNISITALSLSQIGIWNKDLPLMKEGQRLYGSALAALRDAISSRKIVAPEATLATIIILSTYELFSDASDRSQGWVSHARGGSRILQLLGPNMRLGQVGRQLCSRIRTIGIFEAFRTRRTSLLAGLKFHCCPGNGKPDLYCRLQDLMTQVPPIEEAFDTLVTANANKAVERIMLTQLLQQCSALHAQLLTWCEYLREQVHGSLYRSALSVAHSPADLPNGRIFPLAFHFPNLSIAQQLLLYWSTLIVLYRTIQDIDKIFRSNKTEGVVVGSESHFKDNASRSDLRFDHNCPSNATISALANKICQSFEYCYHSTNGTLGVQSTIIPRWVARDFYAAHPEYERELAWCEEVDNMTAPDSRFDLQVMKFGNCSEFTV